MVVDLGTRHFAALIGGKFLRSEGGKRLLEGVKEQQVAAGIGGAVIGHVVNVAALEVGNHRYPNVDIALTSEVKPFESGDVDGSLGVPLWQSAVVRFDYAHGEFSISEAE